MNELQARLAAAIKTVETLMAKTGRTDDDNTAIQTALAEGETVKGLIAQAKQDADALAGLKSFGAQAAAMLPLAVPGVPQNEGPAAEVARVKLTPPEDQPFDSFGDFLKAVHLAELLPHKRDPRLSTKAASGANESVPSDGGFLVGTDQTNELLTATHAESNLVSKTRRIPISANSNGIKINAVNETSRANGSRWGGVSVYWAGEADSVTATRPRFRQMELNLQKLMGNYYATDEELQDAAALQATATMAFSEEFAYKLDDALIRGSGAGDPLGILNSPCLLSISKETGQTAATILYENVTKMWSRMYSRSRSSAVWYINQDIEAELWGMTLAVGTGGVPVYLPPGGLSQSAYATLFGRPVVPLEQCSTLGTVGDIILADFSQYVMIEKGGINAASSVHVRFLQDESVFRFTLRTDGQPIWNSTLTPANGSATQSPFVVLATRA